MITRRNFLASTAALVAASALPPPVLSKRLWCDPTLVSFEFEAYGVTGRATATCWTHDPVFPVHMIRDFSSLIDMDFSAIERRILAREVSKHRNPYYDGWTKGLLE